MLAKLQRIISLWVEEKTGLTATVIVLSVIALLAALMGVVFFVCYRVRLGDPRAWSSLRRAGLSGRVFGDCGLLPRRRIEQASGPTSRCIGAGEPQPARFLASKCQDAANRFAGKPSNRLATAGSHRPACLSRNAVCPRTRQINLQL